MKRTLTLILSLLMVFSTLLTACAPAEGPAGTDTETTTFQESVTKEETKEEEEEEKDYFAMMKEDLPLYDCNGNEIGKTDTGAPLSQAAIDAIPVADSSMTSDQLRQICLDYFNLHLSFQWVPSEDLPVYPTGSTKLFLEYLQFYTGSSIKEFDQYTGKAIKKGTIYAGIPYQNISTGNIYRWMEYYDETTGVMDLKRAIQENGGYDDGAWLTTLEYNRDINGNLLDASGTLCSQSGKDPVPRGEFSKYLYDFSFQRDENNELILAPREGSKYMYPILDGLVRYTGMKYFFSQCSIGSFWGWARVINSANFAWTTGSTVYNGFIPVGLFDYQYEHEGKKYDVTTIDSFGVKTEGNPKKWDTIDVAKYWIKEKGQDALFECYAKLKPADCVVSGGHVMMVKDIHVVRDDNGKVDPIKSYITVYEQFNDAYGFYGYIGQEKTPYIVHGGYVSDYDDQKSWVYDGDSSTNDYELHGDRVFNFSYLQGRSRTSKTAVKNPYLPYTFAEFHYNNDSEESKAYIEYYKNTVPATGGLMKRYSSALAFGLDLSKTGITGLGVEKAEIFTNLDQNGVKLINQEAKSLTFDQYKDLVFAANYAISDVFVSIIGPDGQTTKTLTYRAASSQVRVFDLDTTKTPAGANFYAFVSPIANTDSTVKISTQLGNGEILTVFEGSITA